MKPSSLLLTLSLLSLLGSGCSNKQTVTPPPTPTSTVSVTPTSTPPSTPDESVSLYDRVEALRLHAPLLADATSTDAMNGPLKLPANRDFVVAVASEPIQTWLDQSFIDSIASPDDLCIGKEFQTPEAFREKILSQFKPDDRVYVYHFAPDPKKNPPQGYWDVTVLPNRLGYTSADKIDNAFAWVGGCEAGAVGMYGFNKNWIAYGDGCHESGGPSPDEACHMAIDALNKTVKLK